MEQTRPGGWLGLILTLALFMAGYMFNIEWMKVWGSIGALIWVVMLVIGYVGTKATAPTLPPTRMSHPI